MLWLLAIAVLFIFLSYASVPLYRMFCQVLPFDIALYCLWSLNLQATGYAGTVKKHVITPGEAKFVPPPGTGCCDAWFGK
jgi:hypothetical protein